MEPLLKKKKNNKGICYQRTKSAVNQRLWNSSAGQRKVQCRLLLSAICGSLLSIYHELFPSPLIWGKWAVTWKSCFPPWPYKAKSCGPLKLLKKNPHSLNILLNSENDGKHQLVSSFIFAALWNSDTLLTVTSEWFSLLKFLSFIIF